MAFLGGFLFIFHKGVKLIVLVTLPYKIHTRADTDQNLGEHLQGRKAEERPEKNIQTKTTNGRT